MHNKAKIIVCSVITGAFLVGCNQQSSGSQSIGNQVPQLRNAKSKLSTTTTMSDDVTKLSPQDWYSDWMPSIKKLSATDQLRLEEIHYYVRVANIDLATVFPGSKDNPENVKRIERLMPQANFEATLPLSKSMTEVNGFIPGKTYAYANFLKAVAVIPGYCGDYSSYPTTSLTSEMSDPDTICKRLLATTFAHAVQETSDISSKDLVNITDKINHTLISVAEGNATPTNRGIVGRYPDGSGPFSDNGSQAAMVKGKYYYGRGIKQLSYPSNYANLSLMMYGDLRLVQDPDLVQGDNFLPYLSAIVYTIQPKNGRPSIAEVMDGSFIKRASGNAKLYAEMGYPFTIALVNGGPECTGKNIENTQTRLRAFRYFAEDNHLLTKGFTLTKAEETATNCNNIKYDDTSITAAGARFYYYSPAEKCNLVSWDSNYPIYGGTKFKELTCCTSSKPESKYKLTIINQTTAMGADKITINNIALDYLLAGATLVYPNEKSGDNLVNLEGKEATVTFAPTWSSSGEVKTYNCPKFIFSKDIVLHITTSNIDANNKCSVQ